MMDRIGHYLEIVTETKSTTRRRNLIKREDTSYKSVTYRDKPKLSFKEIRPRISKTGFDVLGETGGWEGCGHASNAKSNRDVQRKFD
jgi:hypothetical protein